MTRFADTISRAGRIEAVSGACSSRYSLKERLRVEFEAIEATEIVDAAKPLIPVKALEMSMHIATR